MIIEKLLTDEDLRARFASNRIDTMVDLCSRGFDLTDDEVELCCRIEPRLWSVFFQRVVRQH
jgi:hypothetical protein